KPGLGPAAICVAPGLPIQSPFHRTRRQGHPLTNRMKTALSIAGSDSSGGAGIQADLKTFAVLGVYGMSAITAVTAQNTLGVKETLAISPELVRAQIDAAAGDIPVDATKSGMLGSAALVEVVEDCIQRNKLQP